MKLYTKIMIMFNIVCTRICINTYYISALDTELEK